MGYAVAPYAMHQFFDDNGDPLAGGKLYTYAAGTTTPRTTYADHTGTVPNTNPIVLDSAGRCTIFLNDTLFYKFVLKNSLDVTIKTIDYIKSGTGVGADGTSTLIINDTTLTNVQGHITLENGTFYLRRYVSGVQDLEWTWSPS